MLSNTLVELPVCDLTKVMARVTKDNSWDEETAKFAEQEYRRFMVLCKETDGGVCPPKIVDEVWHTHILFTQRYQTDCEEYYGKFIHHIPMDEFEPSYWATIIDDLVERTVTLYEEIFGELPDEWVSLARCAGSCGSGCGGGGCAGCSKCSS